MNSNREPDWVDRKSTLKYGDKFLDWTDRVKLPEFFKPEERSMEQVQTGPDKISENFALNFKPIFQSFRKLNPPHPPCVVFAGDEAPGLDAGHGSRRFCEE